MANIGQAVGNFLGFDPTPGFNIANGGSGSAYPAATGTRTLIGTNPGGTPAAPTNSFANWGTGAGGQAADTGGTTDPTYGGYGSAGAQAAAQATANTQAENNAYLDGQEADLRGLLGRTDTSLSQGLGKLDTDYTNNVNSQNSQRGQANSDYGDQRVTTGKDKLAGYNQIARNAGNGYRSLAQIIGRNAGSGSSAFQDLLPDVVGRDTSGKRSVVNDTYASNLGNIDTAQKKTELSFENILRDLATQRSGGERDFRAGIEGQRQDLQSKLGGVSGQRAQNNGGGYDAVRDAQASSRAAIEASRNTVEGFFDQFKSPIQAQQAAIGKADLSAYQVDRSNVNAGNEGSADPTNPYSDILRKKLQEQAV